MKRWTEKEKEDLKELYGRTDPDELQERFGRTIQAVWNKACELGLTRPQGEILRRTLRRRYKDPDGKRSFMDHINNADNRFKPGNGLSRGYYATRSTDKAEEHRKNLSEAKSKLMASERLRVRMGLPQRTKYKITGAEPISKSESQRRRLLRQRGYERSGKTWLYGPDTRRTSHEGVYERRYGYSFKPKTEKRASGIVPPDWSDKQGGFNAE